MAGERPTILVVDADWDERAVLASVLREAGFAVVTLADPCGAGAALRQAHFAAAVIAVPHGDAGDLVRQARRQQPGLKALIIGEPAALPFADDAGGTLVTRPFDPRQLLGC